ncbi:MAG: hypothetical protein ABI439_12235 [Rhodospirillales bacterium]
MLVVQAQLGHHAGFEIVGHDIDRSGEAAQHRQRFRFAKIDRQALLVAIGAEIINRLARRILARC